MTGARLSIVSAALLVVAASLGGCTDGASNQNGGRSTESSPFEVVDPPAGYELAEVRLGTTEPILYSDARPT